MKLSFYLLEFLLFLTITLFQRHDCLPSFDNKNQIYQKLYNATSRTLASTLYPLCSQIFSNKNNIRSEYISSKGFSGRILPIGTFPTSDLAIDYFYGMLCPMPNLPQARKHAQSLQIMHVTYDQNFLIVHCEFIHYLTHNTRVTVSAQIAFDKTYRICSFDGQIENASLAFNLPDAIRQKAILGLCALTQKFCSGKLQQYASINDCKQYLTTRMPFGSFDQADHGNVVCRLVHANFIPLNPARYCSRVGPTGGITCTNKTTDFYHKQPNFMACADRYK